MVSEKNENCKWQKSFEKAQMKGRKVLSA